MNHLPYVTNAGKQGIGDVFLKANHRFAVKRWKIANLHQRSAAFGEYAEEQWL